MNVNKLKIHIISDLVCPWCVIGYKNFKISEKILKNKITLEIDWKPYQLHPNIPANGIDKFTYLNNKGISSQSKNTTKYLKELGTNLGFIFNFNKAKKIPNTLQAHRLLELIQDKTLKSKVVEYMFISYFTDGVDIGSKEKLLNIGKKAELEDSLLERFISSNEGLREVEEEENFYREKNISGVPTFMINNQYILQGAQESETFVSFLNRINQKVEERTKIS